VYRQVTTWTRQDCFSCCSRRILPAGTSAVYDHAHGQGDPGDWWVLP
jgi:hypothetical protein